MKHTVMLLLGLTIYCVTAFAGSPGNQSEGPIEFYVDASCFKMLNQPDLTYLQLHFFVQRSAFKFVETEKGPAASYVVALHMQDTKDATNVFERSWSSTIQGDVAVDSTKDVPLIFENNFALKPGLYMATVILRDISDTSRYGRFTESINVSDYSGNDLMTSHIELASQIYKGGNAEEMFVKNGMTVYPNPSKFFGSNLPRLFLYAEVYNLEYKSESPGTYQLEYIITDESGSVIKEYPAKVQNKAGNTAVILHSIPVIGFKTGRYQLTVRVTDLDSKKQTQSNELFVVFREGESFDEIKSEESYFSTLDAKSAERAGYIISYIGKQDEKKIYDKLDLAGKREFLDRFWKERDPSPGTKTNELLIEYYRRFDEAEQRFSSPNVPGWKSDMGRIYITYGPPAQIEKHEFEQDVIPYQIWYYLQLPNQPTQTLFVFAETAGSSSLKLIHSNARGEFNNPSYQNELRVIR
jgi:GWxTD domain-containing protein